MWRLSFCGNMILCINSRKCNEETILKYVNEQEENDKVANGRK